MITLFSRSIAFSQSSIADSSIGLSDIGLNYSLLQPAADLADRYGLTSAFGISYTYKWSSNYLVSCTYNFLLTMDVKEDDIFQYISTSDGYLINNIGALQTYGLELRGHNIDLAVGKLFPVFGPNPNSGLFAKVGVGFIQHKIFVNYEKSTVSVPQIEDDYLKGYDRLTNGWSLSQNIGYYHFSNSNLGSFHIALSITEGFTQSRRSWDFDKMKRDDKKRLDILAGLNFGLDIPIYSRVPDEFYIY